jgi:hypothetical protein
MPISNRTASDLQHLLPGVVCVSGSFTGNGNTNPTVVDIKGVTAVTRSALGRYTLVLPGKGTLNVSAILVTPLADRVLVACVRSYTPATRTLVVDIYDDVGTPAQDDLATDEQLHLLVLAKNSSAR